MAKIHRGKILHEVASLHSKKIVQIVEDAGYTSHSTFYKHVGEEDLSFKILYKYAKAMDYYFDNEIPELKEWMEKNGLSDQRRGQPSYAALEIELVEWREKYYSLLEKYNGLLENKG